jgi:aspartyl-tRNA synthetase
MKKLNSIYRSYVCNELSPAQVGSEVILSGWIARKRDHGGIVFYDLRDHYGVTQVVFSEALAEKAQEVRVESVVMVKGAVVLRDKEMINPKIPTGEVEVKASELTVLSTSQVLPFQIAEEDDAPEHLRLTYRFLDLRREKLHNTIILRSKIIQKIRELMFSYRFHEFHTPILTSSSPEGARDYLVPSRLYPGKFFALPQAPQQFKQLLMVSGFDRYFQIAPCFRDEDPRADRSPGEFYQLDLEMSFVEQEDVFQLGESLFTDLFKSFSSNSMTETPFPRIRYEDAILRFGSDKPDLRIPLELKEVTDLFKETEFKVFQNALKKNEAIFALPLSLSETPSRKVLDDVIDYFTKMTGRGLGYILYEGDQYKGSFAKLLKEEEIQKLKVYAEGNSCVVFLAAGMRGTIEQHLGRLRLKLGADFDLIEKGVYKFCWITDFPLYERDSDTGKIDFAHNPFSMPQGGIKSLETMDPLDVYAFQYDLVCNGYEFASGAIRNQDPEIMYKAFGIVGYTKEEVDEKFGGLINAFKFGTPPHGGMAPGIERIVMVLADEPSLREVVAFPMSQSGEDLMMKAPGHVQMKQLIEANIRVVLPEKKEK